jgi:hypothetical protein
MARFSALSVISRAVAALLSEASSEDEFPKADYPVLGTAVISGTGGDQQDDPPKLGVSVFPYRVAYNAQRRPASPRVSATGERFRAPILLDLHFLISAWACSALQQMRLLGWAARTLEDTPILTAGSLNRWGLGDETVFGTTESVEIVAEPLSMQELVAIWEVNKSRMQPSLGYVARMIAIDSEILLPDPGIVRSRTLNQGVLVE